MQEKMRRFYREAAAAFTCYHRARFLRLTPALTDGDMLIFERAVATTDKWHQMPYVVGVFSAERGVDPPDLEAGEAHREIAFSMAASHWGPGKRFLVYAHVIHADPSRRLALATLLRLKGCFSVGIVEDFSKGLSYTNDLNGSGWLGIRQCSR
jgi:hypothetical protein